MKIERRGPSKGRLEYHWRVDREQGFESAKFIYDGNGRLMAVDYEVDRKAHPAPAPQPPPRA
jgi:hypothetical protein